MYRTEVVPQQKNVVLGPDMGVAGRMNDGRRQPRGTDRGVSEAPWSTKKLICRGRRWASELVAASLATTAKGKQRLNRIVIQSEIKDVKGFSHVRDICCPGEGHHPKLESETIDYLRNRLVMMVGNLGHAWFYESLPISRK